MYLLWFRTDILQSWHVLGALLGANILLFSLVGEDTMAVTAVEYIPVSCSA